MPSRPALGGLAAALAAAAPAAGAPVAPEGFVPRMPAPEPVVFAMPLEGPLHSGFGARWGRMHSGIDIAVLGTDAVRAPAPGRVTFAGWKDNYSGYGLIVQVRHDGGVETMYAHLSRAGVARGDEVERGDLLGRAGCSGSCTGPHLHFEVRVRGKLVDPLRVLKKKAVR